MRRYEPSTPRVALAIAAVAMTAISLGLSVVLPAQMDASDEGWGWAAFEVVNPSSAGVVSSGKGQNVDAVGTPAATATRCTAIETDRALKT